LLGIILIVISGIFFYFSFYGKKEQQAFFYTQKVFNQFEGTTELTGKLNLVKSQNKAFLDSLVVMIEAGRKDLVPLYQEKRTLALQSEQELSEQYTSDIWAYINESVAEYGKNNHYNYIFGASGNGSLMFADSSQDITSQVVLYINHKYKGELK
jgi:outer membrane protein